MNRIKYILIIYFLCIYFWSQVFALESDPLLTYNYWNIVSVVQNDFWNWPYFVATQGVCSNQISALSIISNTGSITNLVNNCGSSSNQSSIIELRYTNWDVYYITKNYYLVNQEQSSIWYSTIVKYDYSLDSWSWYTFENWGSLNEYWLSSNILFTVFNWKLYFKTNRWNVYYAALNQSTSFWNPYMSWNPWSNVWYYVNLNTDWNLENWVNTWTEWITFSNSNQYETLGLLSPWEYYQYHIWWWAISYRTNISANLVTTKYFNEGIQYTISGPIFIFGASIDYMTLILNDVWLLDLSVAYPANVWIENYTTYKNFGEENEYKITNNYNMFLDWLEYFKPPDPNLTIYKYDFIIRPLIWIERTWSTATLFYIRNNVLYANTDVPTTWIIDIDWTEWWPWWEGDTWYDANIWNPDLNWDWEVGILDWEVFLWIWSLFKYFFGKLIWFFQQVKLFIEKIGTSFTSEVKTFSLIPSVHANENISWIFNDNVDEEAYHWTILWKIDLFFKWFIIFFVVIIWLVFIIWINKKKWN